MPCFRPQIKRLFLVDHTKKFTKINQVRSTKCLPNKYHGYFTLIAAALLLVIRCRACTAVATAIKWTAPVTTVCRLQLNLRLPLLPHYATVIITSLRMHVAPYRFRSTEFLRG